jgi:hypothetical protein
VKDDGSDYVGTKSVAPLIFKTTAKKGARPAERMRITPTGVVEVAHVAAVGTSPYKGTALTVQCATKNGIGLLGTADKGSGATGVYGSSNNGTGVHGSSPTGFAVYGTTNNGVAVRGESYTDGSGIAAISGEGLGAQNIGVLGTANAGDSGTGVYGTSNDGTGVHGSSLHGHAVYGSTENGTGVRGESYTDGSHIAAISGEGIGNQNIGVLGTANTGDSATGVYGTSNNGTGVHGSSLHGSAVYGSTLNGTGVSGETHGTGSVAVDGHAYGDETLGVVAIAEGADVVGIYAAGYDSNYPESLGKAGQFIGDVDVTRNISKGGGSFKIDHPLDPANKYLYHSFVESPDMMNIYNGNVTTDSARRAVVTLPDYFMALNCDFRYQLTVIGQFAQAIVGRQIEDSRFEIHTDKPGVLVSWQVTGIRQDAYAKANRIPTAVEKPVSERGKYLHPEAHGQPHTANMYRRPE